MRFLSLYTPDPKTEAAMGSPEHMEAMGKLMDEMTRAGVLIATGAFLAGSPDARVCASEGRVSVSDSPAADANGAVLGFALLQVKSRAELIEVTQRFLSIAGDGECELHRLLDPPES